MDNNDNNYGFNNSDPSQNNDQKNTDQSGYSDPTDNGNFYNPNTGSANNNSQSDNNYNSSYNNGNDNNYNSSYNNGANNYNSYSNNGTDNNYNNNSNGGYNSNDNSQQEKDGDNQYSQYGGNVQYKWNYDDYEKALHKNKKAKKRGLKPFIITVSCVFGVAIIGLAAFGINSAIRKGTLTSNGGKSNGTTINIQSQPSSSSTSTPASGTKLTNEQVAEKLTPAVVGIEMYNLSSVEPIAEGTGIVISEDGYIVTNAHVVADGQKICVVMHDGKKYDTVKLVGKDTKSDLAVLKINATGLTKATFGDSTQLKVGQEVIAIGNPGGLTFANTVTNGIVSGLNRTVSTSTTGNQMTYIQTNALINPGNSGGPLVNMYGQVVGINTAKVTLSGYEGIGFAIPISTAKPYIDSIIANGYVTGRVKVGVSVYALSDSQAKWYNYPSGLYVESIEKDSDAYKQGLRAKDIITEINGVALANSDSSTVFKTFYNEESKYKAGQTITVKVYKTESNKTVSVSFKLEEDKGDTDTSTQQQGSSDSNGSQSGNGYGYGSGSGSGSQSGNGNSNGSNFWSQFGQ